MSTELLTTAVDCFWLFFGGVLVFFMQTGFTMVEAGFTRSKNTGNIIICLLYTSPSPRDS